MGDLGDRTTRPDPEVFASEGFVADARNLLKVEQATLDDIGTEIDRHTFLDGDELQALIATRVSDKETGRSVRNLFWHLAAMRRNNNNASAFDQRLLAALKTGLSDSFDDEELGTVVERLLAVSAERHAFTRQEKAEDLTGLTATGVRHFNLITDLRPVFDDDRDIVEGMVPVTTLVFALDDSDGLPQVVRVHLSPGELDELCAKVQLAQKKLAQVTKLMAAKSIPVPTV